MTLEEVERDPSIEQWSGMIVHVSAAILIGTMGFKASPDEFGNVELGYDIIPKYQGQGYATETAQALLEWTFRQPSVDCVTAKCLVTNTLSVRVLKQLEIKMVSQVGDLINWKINKR